MGRYPGEEGQRELLRRLTNRPANAPGPCRRAGPERKGFGNATASQAGMPQSLAPLPTFNLDAWRCGVESSTSAKLPCPGLYEEQWQKAHAAMLDFELRRPVQRLPKQQ